MSRSGKLSLVLLALAAVGVAAASDPPDSCINPQNGFIQTVVSVWSGTNYNVRHTTDPGSGQPTVSFYVTQDSADDLGPRIEIAPNGDATVAWWRTASVGEVHVRKYSYATHTLGSDRRVGNSGEDSRHPELAILSGTPWVVYEIDGSSGTAIAVAEITDEPDPFDDRVILRTTGYGGDVDAQIQSEGTHLWATWVDGTTAVGWSVYDATGGTWSSPSYQTVTIGDVAAARASIHATVTGS